MDGDEEAAARLSALVGPFILRRRKADVLTDLPEKWESIVYARLEGEQRALYQAHEQMLRMKIAHEGEEGDDGRSKVEILAELTRLRQIALDPSLLYADYRGGAKEQAIMDTIASCIASGEKMLVFSQFTSYLDIIGAKLSEQGVKHYVITGSTPKKKRLALVDAFNADDTPVFLISLKAGQTRFYLMRRCTNMKMPKMRRIWQRGRRWQLPCWLRRDSVRLIKQHMLKRLNDLIGVWLIMCQQMLT